MRTGCVALEEQKEVTIFKIYPTDHTKPEKIRTPNVYGKMLDEFARRPEQDLSAPPLVFQLIVGYFLS